MDLIMLHRKQHILKQLFTILILGLLLSFIYPACAEDLEQMALQQKAQLMTVPFKQDIEILKANIAQRQQSGDIKQFATWLQTQPKKAPSTISQQRYPKILVFVSFSMPRESLTEWFAQTQQIGGNLVIRGLINNSFKDTATILMPLFKKQPSGLLLDPTLFKRFGITKVPAVVVHENNITCPMNQSCQERFAIVYGNTSLQYALTKIANSQTPIASIAEPAIQKLKETH